MSVSSSTFITSSHQIRLYGRRSNGQQFFYQPTSTKHWPEAYEQMISRTVRNTVMLTDGTYVPIGSKVLAMYPSKLLEHGLTRLSASPQTYPGFLYQILSSNLIGDSQYHFSVKTDLF